MLPVVSGILSTILYSYVFTKKREPQFVVNPVKSVVFKKSLIDDRVLFVSDKNGNQIEDDIFIVQFYFFNSGFTPLKQEDILEDLYLYFDDPNVNILDYKILNSSRSLCKIELNSIDSTRIGISFKILESDDGFSGQIIYTGLPSSDLKIGGAIEGVRSIGDIDDARSKVAWNSVVLIFLIIILIISINEIFKRRLILAKIGFTTQYSLWIMDDERSLQARLLGFTYRKLLIASIMFFIITFSISSLITIGFMNRVDKKKVELPTIPDSLKELK